MHSYIPYLFLASCTSHGELAVAVFTQECIVDEIHIDYVLDLLFALHCCYSRGQWIWRFGNF